MKKLVERILVSAGFCLAACSSTPEVVMEDEFSDGIVELDGGISVAPPPPGDGGGVETDEILVEEEPQEEEVDPCAEPDAGCEYFLGDAGPACGDTIVDPGELCDDGNSVPGDGCTGACTVEPNWDCPPNGGACFSTIICGDGEVEGAEVCDDGNVSDDDGCSSDCRRWDADYDCSTPGVDCEALVVCGDGVLGGTEACDDAGELGGCEDDCSAVQDGWICIRPGEPCILAPFCGDSFLHPGEQCDDNNEDSGDGCSDSCEVEAGFYCPMPGQLCVAEVCGDGTRSPTEQCDDANETGGDGCTDCVVDEGFVCPTPGEACFPRCGDGNVVGYEECDDENREDGDGCGGGCLREIGFDCPSTGGACEQTTCGDGVRGGDEGCDPAPGNTVAGDGCGPTCQIEPTFDASGVATLACGDGLITGAEQCDDGNTSDGDGCSSECVLEEGWNCTELLDLPESVEIAVTYRDFKSDESPGGHPDFEDVLGSDPGIPGAVCEVDNTATCGQLDSDRKPVLGPGTHPTMHGADNFALWFRDEDPEGDVDIEVFDQESLLLTQVGGADSDVYEYDTNAYFPLDDRGHGTSCGNESLDEAMGCCTGNGGCVGHNFHFSTELRYFFQYQGGETLTFRGDDDVWVFINGRLAVDVGGVHCAEAGRVVLGDENSDCSLHGEDYDDDDCVELGTLPECTEDDYTAAEQADDTDDRFGITKGGIYEIVLFHAERHTEYSNFRLTLQGFLAPRSNCSPICGNGIVQRGEVCDDGEDNVTEDEAMYGACVECRSREFCGDGELNGPEICDNGLNISAYEEEGGNACAPGCVAPPYCGDGEIQPGPEWCDDGTEGNTGMYDGCTAECQRGPYCGDGNIDEAGGEVCDDGPQNGGYGRQCAFDCQPGPYCGDGIRNGPEQCDEGVEGNTGEYGGCTAECVLAPRCGDNVLHTDQGEECDDGINDGGYGECAPECKIGPFCGDGVRDEENEQCDDGENTGEYGKCAPGCLIGPRCGDRMVQEAAGEECDEGPQGNNRCTPTCKRIVPKVSR